MKKIIFTLLNEYDLHQYSEVSLSLFDWLLQKNPVPVALYIQHLGCFEERDFHNLHKRIVLEPQYKVVMNEKHVLTYFAAVSYTCRAFTKEEERVFLLEYIQEDQEKFDKMQETVERLGELVSRKFTKDFGNLKSFQKLLKRIEDFG